MDRSEAKTKKVISQYKSVFSSPAGKAVLYDLMKSNFLCGSTPFVPGQPDTTARNIGKQELVQKIMFILKVDPEQFLARVEEQEESHV